MALFRKLHGTRESSFQIGKAGPLLQRVGATARLQLANLLRWLPAGAAIEGFLSSDGSGDLTSIKSNFNGAAPPTISNDSTQGYVKWSRWLDLVNKREYVCFDASAGAAVWVDTTQDPFTDLGALTREPTGFPNLTDSSISFDPTGPPVRTFTIQPKAPATEFSFYVDGKKFTKNSAQTVQITDTAGLWYIYFNASGVLQANQTAPAFYGNAFVAVLYWNTNAVTNKYILGEERHGIVMDWKTHEYLHDTRGTAYDSRAGGFDLTGYTLDTASDAAVTVGLSNGKIEDEDLEHSIVHSATPTNPFEQILADPAQIPVYHRAGNPGLWVKDVATTFWFKNAATRVAWNQNTAGTWGQAEAANNEYVAYWIVATNDPSAPIISLQGQRADGNLADSKANNTLSSLDVGGLPFVEMRVLYRLLLRTATGFAGTRKAKLSDVLDLRTLSGIPGGSFVPSSHSALSGLDAHDHKQYQRVRNFGFREQDRTYLKTGDGTFGAMALFEFFGSDYESIPQQVDAIVSTGDAGNTGEFRIYDVTNSLVIALVTGVTHAAKDTPKIVNLTITPANVPTVKAMWEIQARKSAGGGEVRIHDLSMAY